MNRTRAAGWLLSIALLPGLAAHGAGVQFLSVTRDGSEFLISASFIIDGCMSEVREVFADFARLVRLNPSISSSAVLLEEEDVAIVSTTLRECILFFCEDLVMVAAVEQTPAGGLEATVLPGYGDFSSGHAQWRFVGIGDQTQVLYVGRMHLDQRLPPLFGFRLVRRSIEKNLRATVRNAEQLAAEPTTEQSNEQGRRACGPEGTTPPIAQADSGSGSAR